MKSRHRSHEEIFGCPRTDMREMRAHCQRLLDSGVSHGRTPIGAYRTQEKTARRRGIAWEFTFSQWWQVWVDSGKWDERGPSGYVMCRKGDVGPYSPGNVTIATTQENSHEARLALRDRDLPIGVCARRRTPHRYIAQRAINGKNKYLGSFGTPEAAHAAYEAAA